MCSSNKSSFLWLLHISVSPALIILVPFDPLLLMSVMQDAYLCNNFCLFSSVCANICNPSGNNKVDQHMPSCPIYLMQCDIHDIFPTVTSALPITYLQCALSPEYLLMADWTKARDLTAEQHIQQIFFSVTQFSPPSPTVDGPKADHHT